MTRRGRIDSLGLRLTLGVMLCFATTACNEVDLDRRARADGPASTADEPGAGRRITTSPASMATGAQGDRERAADMESIGGEASKRIYYQFIDDRGGVHFVERLAEVPSAWRDRVGFVEMDRPPPLTPAEARKAWTLSDAETTSILASLPTPSLRGRAGGRQSASVVLYSATWCGYCTKARRHLDDEGIDYEIRDVDIQAVANELREKTGRGGVPVLDYDGQILRGYSAGQYRKAIDAIRG